MSEHSLVRLEDQEKLLLGSERPKNHEESKCDFKLVSFFSIGILTLFYVVAELGAAIYIGSLVLLSDGFHNLSDVISLYIAYWARQATKRDSSDEMSYGWARSEILGGLTNGCFLLSLVLYVLLESIPKFINPIEVKSGDEILFIIISATGLGINLIGTIVFSLTGNAHGHSHSHGGGGHSHGGGHAHGHGDKDKKKKKKKEQHELEDSGKSNGEKKEKKEKKEGHAHGHGHKEGEKKEKKEKHGHKHGHDHKEEKAKPKRDENVHAVFLHFLGDACSSVLVLTAGILLKYFKGHKWVYYIDPVSSILVCGLILYTTVPLVKRCAMILLQHTGTIKVNKIKKKLMKVEGLLSLHDFHVWQLVDGMVIASVHIAVEEGVDFTNLITEVKNIFHKFGVHSTSIQPEFVPRNFTAGSFCHQNCVKECKEDWCCKKSADKTKKFQEEFSIKTEL